MDRYIGIDAHSESCTVAVMGPSGKRIRQHVLDTQAKVLIDFLKGIAGTLHVCLEEGQLAEWLVEALSPHVKEISIVQPKEHRGRKSDADDAWSLAELIRVSGAGTYVFKPTSQYRPLREAVRTYGVSVKELTRAKNRFRSLLRSRGVSGLDASIYDPDPKQRESWLRKLPPAYRLRAEWLADEVDSRTAAHDQAEEWLKAEAKKCPEVERIKSVPGLGVVRAAQVVALVVTPHRFRKTRQFWSYAGLGIVTRASSEWKRSSTDGAWQRERGVVQTRGLNLNRQPLLKAVFKGAATTVLASHNPLREHFDRLVAAGTAPHLARLTIARRIAAATLAIWKKKEVYDPSKHRSQEAA
jgi:transposase